MLQKKCPFCYEMDDIFGERHNANPPVLMEPGRVLLAGQVDSSYSSSSQSHDAAGTDEAADGRHDLAKDGSAAAKPVPSQVSGKGLLGKRALTPAGATTVAGASNLHDALLLIHEEKSQRREKRHKRDSELQEQQLELQKEQLELQREEMRLREK